MNPSQAASFQFSDLRGKTLLVTGVTRGIGRALLPGLLAQGLNLVLVSRGIGRLEGIAAELKVDESRIRLFECDLSSAEAVESTARRIVEERFPVDALLHNAAIDPRNWFEAGDQAFWGQVFQVNLFSAIALTRRLLPLLRESAQGRILFTGSVMQEMGGACLTAYAASKGAILGATTSLAHELKGTGITVNCVVPGAIQVEKEEGTPEGNARLISWQSVPRRLDTGDLLGPICLLLSGAGGGITAQAITVDGGLLHPLADPYFQGRNLERPAVPAGPPAVVIS